jgi:hypothetical protein
MTVALKTPSPTEAQVPPPYKLTGRESVLQSYFVAAFTGAEKPDWALRAAVCNVTDDLKQQGETPEQVIKRIKYIAAIPLAFHYRVGYDDSQSRLTYTVAKATSIAIGRYFIETPA